MSAAAIKEAIREAGGVVSVGQMAQEWGWRRQHVDRLTRRDDFPAPFLDSEVGSDHRVWLRPDVIAWRATYSGGVAGSWRYKDA